MDNKKTVFCFEGINNRVWEIPRLFSEEMIMELKAYSQFAANYLGTDFYTKLEEGRSLDPLETSYLELVLTYLSDIVIYNKYISIGIKPDVFIGFSLGLNTAEVCSGMITFEDGLKVLKADKKCMDYLAHGGEYGMALVVGLSAETIEQIMNSINCKDKVKIACEASEYTVLITGNKECINKLKVLFVEEGVLKINEIYSFIPFHFGLRDSVIENEVNKIDNILAYTGKVPILSVYSLEYINKSTAVKELKRNIYEPMKWREAILKLENNNYIDFWDVSLTASNKKITTLSKEDSKFHTLKQLKIKGGDYVSA